MQGLATCKKRMLKYLHIYRMNETSLQVIKHWDRLGLMNEDDEKRKEISDVLKN